MHGRPLTLETGGESFATRSCSPPAIYKKRGVLNGIFHIVRSGCAWLDDHLVAPSNSSIDCVLAEKISRREAWTELPQAREIGSGWPAGT
jgi:transposase